VSACAGAAASEAAVSANTEAMNMDLEMRNMVAPTTVMSAGEA
jgi:hypothetical protein